MPAIDSACWAISIAGSRIEKGPARDAQGRQLNVYAEIDDGDPAASKLTNITGAAKFTPCTTDSEYREFIDNILLGRDLAKSVLKKSFVRVVFNDAGCEDSLAVGSLPGGHRAPSALTSSHTSR